MRLKKLKENELLNPLDEGNALADTSNVECSLLQASQIFDDGELTFTSFMTQIVI